MIVTVTLNSTATQIIVPAAPQKAPVSAAEIAAAEQARQIRVAMMQRFRL
jgi:hypothetical protein